MFDFAGKRWWYLGVSFGLFLVAAVILAFPPHLRAGIEFTSGSSFTLRFTEQPVAQDGLRSALSAMGYPEARIQGAGENRYLIRTRELEGAPALRGGEVGPVPGGEIDTIQAGLEERFGALVREEFATVSGTVSSEIVRNATFAVLAASVAILAYISIAFRRVPRPWRYGTAAVIALLHDTIIILGLFSLLGKWRGTEVDTAFITAILTVIGFSVHDTIVVFDRMREKLSADPYIPFTEAVNASLTETLARSLNTTFTVVITVVALLLIGGVTIRNFLLVLLVGVIAGTYSSIGVAAQTLVVWENNDIGKFLRRITGRTRPPAAEVEPA